jgi:hypothetical protein
VQYHDDPVDSYYDGYNEVNASRKSKSKLTFKLALLAIASFIGYSTLGTTFATNVQLGSSVVEFGQGVRLTTACSPTLTLTPYATFANASGANGVYRLTTIDLTGISNNCYGKDLIIRAYDSVTANALVLYQTGGTTNYDSIRVYNNNGIYSLAGSGLTSSEISSITGGFRVTLFNNESPAAAAKAAATSVYRFTVETADHDTTLSQSSLPSGSMVFNGTNSTIDYAANNAFVLGTGAFTIELWAKLDSNLNDETFYDTGGDVNSSAGFAFWVEGNQLKLRRNGCCADLSVSMNSNWRNGSYHHFAAVRGNGKLRIYVDGVKQAEEDDLSQNYNRNAPSIGRLFNFGGYELGGDIRNLRVVKGTALYSANFTPPTVPLTKVSGTLLLLLAQDPNNPTKDSSDNVWVPSNNGNLPLPTYRAP